MVSIESIIDFFENIKKRAYMPFVIRQLIFDRQNPSWKNIRSGIIDFDVLDEELQSYLNLSTSKMAYVSKIPIIILKDKEYIPYHPKTGKRIGDISKQYYL